MSVMKIHDPDDPNDDPRYKLVTCTRCAVSYQCTPYDDFNKPAPELGWTKGRICDSCLLILARAKATNR